MDQDRANQQYKENMLFNAISGWFANIVFLGAIWPLGSNREDWVCQKGDYAVRDNEQSAWKCTFQPLHNEVKSVLSIKESYSIQFFYKWPFIANFHWLRSFWPSAGGDGVGGQFPDLKIWWERLWHLGGGGRRLNWRGSGGGRRGHTLLPRPRTGRVLASSIEIKNTQQFIQYTKFWSLRWKTKKYCQSYVYFDFAPVLPVPFYVIVVNIFWPFTLKA